MNRFGFFILIIFIFSLQACCLFADRSIPKAPTWAELCRLLGRDSRDYNCASSTPIHTMLEESFPPGKSTIENVHKVLGPYLIDSHPRPIGGFLEEYAILRTLLNPIRASFLFDENGILLRIEIWDW